MSQEPIRLVDAGWARELSEAIRADSSEFPFLLSASSARSSRKVHLNISCLIGPIAFR